MESAEDQSQAKKELDKRLSDKQKHKENQNNIWYGRSKIYVKKEKNKYVLYRNLAIIVMKTNIYKGAKGPNSIYLRRQRRHISSICTLVVSPTWIYKDENINTFRIRGINEMCDRYPHNTWLRSTSQICSTQSLLCCCPIPESHSTTTLWYSNKLCLWRPLRPSAGNFFT